MMDEEDEANVPTTNLSEVVHSVWQRVDSYSTKLSLYEASVGDLANSILQSAREKSFLLGHYMGTGPSLQHLMERIRSGRRSSITGTTFSESVRKFVETVDLTTKETCFDGGQTMSRKRPVSEWNNENDNVSHRPDVEFVRKASKCRNYAHATPASSNVCAADVLASGSLQLAAYVKESNLHDTLWAIRRIGLGRVIKCQGMKATGRGRCNKKIDSIVAASFFGTLKYSTVNFKNQFMWFCASDVRCTWKVNNNITSPPMPLKDFWLVQEGTNLTQEEVDALNKGGYILNSLKKVVEEEPHTSTTIGDRETNPKVQTPTSASLKRGHMRYRSGVSTMAKVRMERGIALNGHLCDIIKVPSEHKEVYVVESFESSSTGKRYQVTIGIEPKCTCEDFAKNISSGKYIPCKHLYFVFLKVKGLDVNENMFIHQPVLTTHDLFHVFAIPNCY